MKRIFTLAIIAMIATLSFAQATAVKATANKQIQKVMTTQQMQKGMTMKAAADAKAQAAQENYSSVLRTKLKYPVKNGFASPEKAQMSSVQSATPRTATPKTAETVDLDMKLVLAEYYGAPDYDWYYCFNTNDGLYQFRFDIANQPAEALPLDQEFTLDDMVADYSWGRDLVSGAYIEYASCTFKATEGANGIDYHATVVDLDGNTYNLKLVTIAYPEITDYKTVNFTADQVDFVDQTKDGGVFQLIGWGENEFSAFVAFYSTKIVGTYTIDDVYAGATRIFLDENDWEGVEAFDIEADVRADGATVIYRGYNGVEYTLNFEYTLEEPTITNLTAELPYANGFDTAEEQAEAAIYDANEDGRTFAFANDYNTNSTTARYTYSGANDADDYVVFPGLALKAGKKYLVSVDARAYGATYPERLEVVAGTVAKASQLNIPVIAPTDLESGDYQTMSAEFCPEADGVYYIALHAISDADMFYLYADNFSIKELDPNTPNDPIVEVTADENAILAAIIKVEAPRTTIGGHPIKGGVDLNIKRNGVTLWDVTVPAGYVSSYQDIQIPAPGKYTYTVTATVNGLVSNAASQTVYVGEDLPDDVENLAAADLNNKVGLTWTAPTEGINGGVIVPELINYNVYPVEMIEFFGMQFPAIDFDNPYASGVVGTETEIDFNTNEGAQAYTYFGVTAENTAGESNGAMAAVLTGAPYELPVHEPFNGGLKYWWGVANDEATEAAQGGLFLSKDNELVYVAPVEGWIALQSGKISLAGADNPGLTFDYKTDAPCTLSIKVVTPEGEENIGLMPVENAEYETAVISLEAYADQPWVRFFLVGEFDAPTDLFIDNITVLDLVDNDLNLTLSAPKTLTAGSSVVVKATVTNMGQQVAQDYAVKFYVNDQLLPTPLFETPALAFFESAEFETEIAASIFDELGDVVVKAEVEFALDTKPESNVDEAIVSIVAPAVAPVETLTAEVTGEGLVLNWTVAEHAYAEVTEDFESYEVGIVADGETMGPWSAIDGDKGMTYGWNSASILWDYTGEPYAFAIMNFPQIFGSATDIEAPSGEQALMFMSVTDAQGNGFAADDWFVSPELPGIAQTISFKARPMTMNYGPETIEVMASEDGQNWTKVASFDLDNEYAFDDYSANLAEGTKYFALHYISNDVFAAFVDDLKYTAGGSNPVAFNIYLDQNYQATVAGDVRTYTITDAILADHEVAVTAVYPNAESAPKTVYVDVTTGIQNINANNAKAEIYTVNGVRVQNANKPGVYVINGRKAVIK